jgi:predicted secreted protein
VASPGSGTYDKAVSVTFVNSELNPNIMGISYQVYYTLDGTNPDPTLLQSAGVATTTKLWDRNPITISKTTTLKAIALQSAVVPNAVAQKSAVATFNYVINIATVSAPVASPGSGTYNSAVSVTFTNVQKPDQNLAGGYVTTVYYTLDGAIPTLDKTSSAYNSTKVWDWNPITISKTTILKAMAVKTCANPLVEIQKSEVATFNYVINIATVKVLNPLPAVNSLPVAGIGTVTLAENGSTGYSWHYTIDNTAAVVFDSDSTTASPTGVTGASINHTWKFRVLKTDKAQITFKYYRTWEGEQTAANTVVYGINN